MKILIDIEDLKKKGVLSESLAETLKSHSLKDTNNLGINSLLGFGAIVVALGITAYFESAKFSAFCGLLFVILGFLIVRQRFEEWKHLGNVWMVTGALILSISVGILIDHPFQAPLVGALIVAIVGVVASSKLLVGLTPFILLSALGGSTGYWHACYAISMREPTITIAIFSVLMILVWELSKKLDEVYKAQCVIFSRACAFVIHSAFWIGSLFGDSPGKLWREQGMEMLYLPPSERSIQPLDFTILWALVIIGGIFWGMKNNSRFMVNISITFGAIHFYTQWFERIGAEPLSVAIAGVVTIAVGLWLKRYNSQLDKLKLDN